MKSSLISHQAIKYQVASSKKNPLPHCASPCEKANW